jgi:hypothetical protein
MSGPWAHARLFSATLLVEQGWSQFISLCPPAIPPSGQPFYTKRGRKCKQGAMCTCARRAGRCGFGERSVTCPCQAGPHPDASWELQVAGQHVADRARPRGALCPRGASYCFLSCR